MLPDVDWVVILMYTLIVMLFMNIIIVIDSAGRKRPPSGATLITY